MSETKPDCYCTLQDLKDLTVLPYGWVMIRRSVGGVADLEDFEIKILGDVDLLAENAKLKRENEAWRQAGEDAIKQLGTIVGLMSITALLTAEESE